jgi:hypothetical protein
LGKHASYKIRCAASFAANFASPFAHKSNELGANQAATDGTDTAPRGPSSSSSPAAVPPEGPRARRVPLPSTERVDFSSASERFSSAEIVSANNEKETCAGKTAEDDAETSPGAFKITLSRLASRRSIKSSEYKDKASTSSSCSAGAADITLIAVDVIFQYILGFNLLGFSSQNSGLRNPSFFNYHMVSGSFLSKLFPLITAYVILNKYTDVKKNILFKSSVIIIFLAIIFSGERMALINAVFFLFIFSIFYIKKTYKYLIAIVFIFFFNVTFLTKFQDR